MYIVIQYWLLHMYIIIAVQYTVILKVANKINEENTQYSH